MGIIVSSKGDRNKGVGAEAIEILYQLCFFGFGNETGLCQCIGG